MNCYKVTFACGLYFYVEKYTLIHAIQCAEQYYKEWKGQKGNLIKIENII